MHHIMHQQSYDAWTARCSLEKADREARKYEHLETRKRIYPCYGETATIHTSSSLSTRKTYVNLPTIPPVRVLFDMEMSTVVVPEKKRFLPTFEANSIPTMPVPACYSRQLQHSASTPNSALSYSLFSLVTPLPAPHELFQSDDRLCPEIWAAIRALPLSQLLAALEQGQSVFRRAPSQSVASFPIFGRGTVSYKPFTRVNPQSIPDSQRVSFRPLLKIPLFTTPTVIPYQPPTS